MSQYSSEQIQFILAEIEKWRQDGLLTERGAQILRRRYEIQPPAPSAPPSASPPPPLPASAPPSASPPPPLPASVPSPAARPGLAQTLLSEASIKIALYLGAFFVIAAALILAALVETLRLPILSGASVLFGVGALGLKKRLPQPSFILWLVFSALLLISGDVLADLLNLFGTASSTTYWLIVLLAISALWGFSTWLYTSRFFSLAAFGALAAAAMYFADIFSPSEEVYLFALTATGLVGLAGVWLLKAWQSQKFALPLYWLLQAFEVIILLIALTSMIYNLFANYVWEGWLFSALIWLTAFIFYTVSDFIIPSFQFRFLAAGALLPMAWLTLTPVKSSNTIFPLGVWAWGLALLLAGEAVSFFKNDKVARFALPLNLVSLPLFFITGLTGKNENDWLGLGLFAASGLVLSLTQIRRERWWVWTVALACWAMTWLFFFQLPPIEKLEISNIIIASGLLIPLSLLDWLLPGKFTSRPNWRWPLRFFGVIALAIGSLLSLFASRANFLNATLAFGLFALLGLVYALRFWLPILMALFTSYLSISILFGLAYFNLNWWLPALTALSVVYYFTGYVLTRIDKKGHWANVLRWSGLALGLLTSLAAVFYNGSKSGWYVGILGILFVIETFARFTWLELAVYGIYTLAFVLVLAKNEINTVTLYLMGITVILLSLDMFFARTLRHRTQLKILPRLAGWLLAIIGSLFLFLDWQSASGLDVAASLTYSLLFLAYALFYRSSDLSFPFYASGAITALTIAGFANLERWTGPLILLSLVYYALGFVDKPQGWGEKRRLSGLLLATATALSAPQENSGLRASLPVAVAATLWAVEAFRRRNVWLGFPANGLYLMAYYIILLELNVDQPQFFSVGAALLGLLMHYLLTRSGAKQGAFLIGLVSQLILLGTTYIQMVSTNSLAYFAGLFFQSIVVLLYGLVFRSRSLVFTPIVIVVLGVITVVFSVLRGLAAVLMIGCTGILFIVLGILAVWQRERIADWRERLNEWKA